MTQHSDRGYREILPEDEELKTFVAQLSEFNRAFCDHVATGEEFTLRIEVHGNQGSLIHCRVYSDRIVRPHGVEKRVEERRRQKVAERRRA